MDRGKITRLIISIVVCQLAGVIGSFFTFPNISTWYAGLVKPSFVPPNWLFAPAWTTLFILMGIALFLVWERRESEYFRPAVYVFSVQLVLNILWSALFFGLQSPFLGFVEIIPLWIAILASIVIFYRVDRRAGYLLIPYICWVSFAAILNYSVWILNA